ncbi:MAG: response regulator [Terriglobia bacterium]
MDFRIMAVDDEPAILDLVKALVEPLGMSILTSSDSREAAEMVETEIFDGFLLDAHMPAPNGFELAQRIRRSRANSKVPIALLTGYDDVDTMRKGFQAGVTFFLGKPFTRDRACGLFAAMRGVILREKRQHARLPYRAPVECRWGELADRVFKADSINVGEGGMLFAPTGGLSAGDNVRLEFSMPNRKKPIKTQAKVLRNEPPDRVAVQFVGIDLDDQESIREYIFGRGENPSPFDRI